MKKIIALAMALLMLAMCFASCGKKGDGDGDVVTIKYWSSSGATHEFMTQLVDEFNNGIGKEKGIEIEYTLYLNDYAKVIESGMQMGTVAEILSIPGDQAKVNYANKGDVIAIEDMPGGKEFLEEYGEIPLTGREKINGKVYFVNASQTVQGLIYNKDLFKKAGLVDENGEPTPPKTISEYIEYGKKLTDKANNIYGIGLPLKDQGWTQLGYPNFVCFGEDSPNGMLTKIDWENETYEYTENWLKYIDFVKAVKESGAIFPGAEGLDNDTMRAQFAAGRIGMFMGASWDVGVLTDQFPAQCEWAVAPIPVYDGMERYRNYSTRGSGPMFSKTALEHKEEAMFVYEWVMSEEVRLKLYEGGYSIPIRKGVTELADESKFDEHWAQFANLVKNEPERKRKLSPSLALEGESSGTKAQYVWQDTSIDASKYLPELKETYTQALRKGIKDGTIDKEFFIQQEKE